MQIIKVILYIVFSLCFLFSVETGLSQEDSNSELTVESDSTDMLNEKKGFKLSRIFKRNKSSDELDSDFEFEAEKDSIDLSENKKGLFDRSKKDSADAEGGLSKPQKISVFNWNKMNYTQQDSLLRAWDDYDREFYKEKKRYKFSRKEVDIAIKLKQNRNLYEKIVYRKARKKPFKFSEKLIKRKNKRYKKTLRFDRMNKSDTELADSLGEKRKYEMVNRRYKREAKKEAIRKNKVIVKYNRKEDRLRQKYELTDNEMVILNKGKGMRLKGTELLVFNKARKKQENFTEKLIKLRRKRAFELQNQTVQKKMNDKNKTLRKRDKEQYSDLYKKKKKRKNDKHDSYEYPKRYHK
jgi:hypothetical protein